jgi:GT2 family glycosyltransferase
MVTRKDIFSDLDGFDENLPGNFNDVDFCLHERGWLIVWTPYANLIHHKSATRGHDAFPPRWENEAAITEGD